MRKGATNICFAHMSKCGFTGWDSFTGADRRAVEKEFANEVAMMHRLGCHPSLVLFLGVCPNPISILFEYLPFSLL